MNEPVGRTLRNKSSQGTPNRQLSSILEEKDHNSSFEIDPKSLPKSKENSNGISPSSDSWQTLPNFDGLKIEGRFFASPDFDTDELEDQGFAKPNREKSLDHIIRQEAGETEYSESPSFPGVSSTQPTTHIETKFTESVQDFLRQSQEIKDDLTKLASMKANMKLNKSEYSPTALQSQPRQMSKTPNRPSRQGEEMEERTNKSFAARTDALQDSKSSVSFDQDKSQKTFQTDGYKESQDYVEKSIEIDPDWKRINFLLYKHGFAPIPFIYDGFLRVKPDYAALHETLSTILLKDIPTLKAEKAKLLDECMNLRSSIDLNQDKYKDQIREAKQTNAELERMYHITKQKLDTVFMKNKRLEEELNISMTEAGTPSTSFHSSPKKQAVFKRFFNRDPGEDNTQDAQIMNLIAVYEDYKKAVESRSTSRRESLQDSTLSKASEEYERVSRSNSKLKYQNQTLASENEELRKRLGRKDKKETESRSRSGSHSSRAVLTQALELLSLSSYKQLLPAINKMQQVIRAIPKLEAFIKAVTEEIFSQEADQDEYSSAKMDKVIPTIATWKAKVLSYESLLNFRVQLCEELRLKNTPGTTNKDILKAVKTFRQESQHFQQLFECRGEDVGNTMTKVFMFVLEMKRLLQFARRVMEVGEEVPLSSIIEAIKYQLGGRSSIVDSNSS